MSTVSRAYDRISSSYDSGVIADQWIRDQLASTYGDFFRKGDRILEIGCGTGIDTEFLASHGCLVTAIDVSRKMLDHCSARMRDAGLENRVECLLLDAGDIGQLGPRTYDGIVSGFGALNTIALDRLAVGSARILTPGGRMLLHFVGACSLWERLYLFSRGRVSEAVHLGRQETRIFQISGLPVAHSVLPPLVLYERHFSRFFELEDRFAMGVLRPPPTMRIAGALVPVLTRLEQRFNRSRPLLNWGRFYVLNLRLRRQVSFPTSPT